MDDALEKNVYIESAKFVCDKLNETSDHKYTHKQVRTVLKKDFDMSYRKIIPSSLHSNSVKNLVLR